MTRSFWLLLWLLLATAPQGHAQQTAPTDCTLTLQMARARIAILASKDLAGRGYHDRGALRAAAWLALQFQAVGLQPLSRSFRSSEDYFQTFPLTDIALVQQARLRIGAKNLRVGRDFIVHPASAKTSQSWASPLVYAPLNCADGGHHTVLLEGKVPESVANRPEMKFAKRLQTCLNADGILIRESKLTAVLPNGMLPKVAFTVLDRALPRPEKWVNQKVKAQVTIETVNTPARNVMGYLPGTDSTLRDSFIVVCGHYDHLGRQGKAIFRGAHDNASGIAFLLALTERLKTRPLPYPVLFVAFGAEELGLLGSEYFVQHPPLPLSHIRAVLNFDLLGHGDKGLMAVGGKDYPQLFAPLARRNDSLKLLPTLAQRPNAPNSDHYPFTQQGIPALFFYTLGGPPHYHDIYDTPETLGLQAFWPTLRLIEGYLRER